MPNTPKFVHLKGAGLIIAIDAIADINTENKTVTLKGERYSHSLRSGDDYRVLADFGLKRPPQSWCYTEVDV